MRLCLALRDVLLDHSAQVGGLAEIEKWVGILGLNFEALDEAAHCLFRPSQHQARPGSCLCAERRFPVRGLAVTLGAPWIRMAIRARRGRTAGGVRGEPWGPKSARTVMHAAFPWDAGGSQGARSRSRPARPPAARPRGSGGSPRRACCPSPRRPIPRGG